MSRDMQRMSVTEYQRLAEIGVLTKHDKVELLDELIVPRLPRTPLHAAIVGMLHDQFREVLPHGWYVRIHGSLVTSDSVPEPDLVIVHGRPGDYCRAHPTCRDASLIAEVADRDLPRLGRKGAIYARAGAPEYWIVNLVDWQLERMTQPRSDGTFGNTEVLHASDVAPVTIDGQVIARLPLMRFSRRRNDAETQGRRSLGFLRTDQPRLTSPGGDLLMRAVATVF